MIERALEIHPGDVDALRLKGEIKFRQELFAEALENYRLAYEQARNPASEAGQDFLKILKNFVFFLKNVLSFFVEPWSK